MTHVNAPQLNIHKLRHPNRVYAYRATAMIFLFMLIAIAFAAAGYFIVFHFLDGTSDVCRYDPSQYVSENSRGLLFSPSFSPRCVIIDAGHGGADGGARGVTGVEEKDINLALSLKTASFLRMYGINVLLTRETDQMLNIPGAKSRKLSDVTERVKFCRENPNNAFVSIHMNKYPLESCRGLQVFYSANAPESKLLAEMIKNTVTSSIQPDNNRTCKKAGDSIFVLDRIETCAVLVECGFLSNYEESRLLQSEAYQNRLAFVLAAAIRNYLYTEN
ncbi:MAG: N-acetylmuramoyl-L-alanine amidase [Oscillospiraceae bacterium]|nr:N-acetylmuramoyl-L-alanine amidase [Oscillospiraceae bacterium]